MGDGYADMGKVPEAEDTEDTDSNPWKESFDSKKGRGFVLAFSVFMFISSHLGFFMTPERALAFGMGAVAMFSAWAADMRDWDA